MVKTISKKADASVLLRLPDSMRKRLARVAKSEKRSMNAVIMVALARYFESERPPPVSIGYRLPADLKTALDDLRDRLANQDQKLTELIKKADTGDLTQLIKKKIE
jgi:hypothetical protein